MRYLLLTSVLLFVLVFTDTSSAQTTGNRLPTLEQRLMLGLQLRLPSDFAFVDAVIDTVNRGELPVKVVDRVFFWSRFKAAQRPGRRAIIYFQPGLTRLAGQLGVQLQPDPPAGSGGS